MRSQHDTFLLHLRTDADPDRLHNQRTASHGTSQRALFAQLGRGYLPIDSDAFEKEYASPYAVSPMSPKKRQCRYPRRRSLRRVVLENQLISKSGGRMASLGAINYKTCLTQEYLPQFSRTWPMTRTTCRDSI
jgi:hypothetical protein